MLESFLRPPDPGRAVARAEEIAKGGEQHSQRFALVIVDSHAPAIAGPGLGRCGEHILTGGCDAIGLAAGNVVVEDVAVLVRRRSFGELVTFADQRPIFATRAASPVFGLPCIMPCTRSVAAAQGVTKSLVVVNFTGANCSRRMSTAERIESA